MPRNKDIKKVLVIGSGPIIIGQAAEFDYAGTQACRSLKEEGIEVVLLNSNPATIMTDKDIADRVYIEPLTVEVVEQLILKEKPDSVLPTLGGQAGLNLAMELDEKGFLKEHNIRLIGTTAQTIKKAEEYLYVRIPYIKPVIIANCLLVLNGSLRSFEFSYLLTHGGPGNASELMTTYMYKQAFSSMKYGYGSSVAIMIVIICMVVGMLFRKFTGGGDDE